MHGGGEAKRPICPSGLQTLRKLARFAGLSGAPLTRIGILSGGAFAFFALAAACVVQQHGRLAAGVVVAAPAPMVPAPEPLPAPLLRAEFNAGTLVLTGRVPDASRQRAIVERAQSLYGQGSVLDRMQVGAVARPAWLDAAFPPDLRDTRHAIALLQDGRLLVVGETTSDAARARVDAALREFASPDLRLDVRLNTGEVDLTGADAAPALSLSPSPSTPRRAGSAATGLQQTSARP